MLAMVMGAGVERSGMGRG